ncbi:MAG: hypothetical protein V4692_15540 [Bdellovibrionota bacterium]
MRAYFSAVFFSAVLVACATPGTSTLAEPEYKNLEETAEISARAQWCGLDFKPFLSTSMQFERLDESKSEMQITRFGHRHEALVTQKTQALSASKCEAADLEKIKTDYHQKLNSLCEWMGKRDGLKLACAQARKTVPAPAGLEAVAPAPVLSFFAAKKCVSRSVEIEMEKKHFEELKSALSVQSDLPYVLDASAINDTLTKVTVSYRRKSGADVYLEPVNPEFFKTLFDKISSQVGAWGIKKISASFVPNECP